MRCEIACPGNGQRLGLRCAPKRKRPGVPRGCVLGAGVPNCCPNRHDGPDWGVPAPTACRGGLLRQRRVGMRAQWTRPVGWSSTVPSCRRHDTHLGSLTDAQLSFRAPIPRVGGHCPTGRGVLRSEILVRHEVRNGADSQTTSEVDTLLASDLRAGCRPRGGIRLPSRRPSRTTTPLTCRSGNGAAIATRSAPPFLK